MPATAPEPTYLFLHGADMDPTAILVASPGARFIARARVTDGAAAILARTALLLTEIEPWGILIAVPDAAPDQAPSVAVITDDGREFMARAVTTTAHLDDPAAVVAAARYWELPPDYVGILQARVSAGHLVLTPPISPGQSHHDG